MVEYIVLCSKPRRSSSANLLTPNPFLPIF
jgi:hypothetical protein